MNIIVNEKGLDAIANFLFENHKKRDTFTRHQICVWASEAEWHAYNNNAVFIELNSRDSLDGRSKCFYLDQSHYDYYEQGMDYDYSQKSRK